MKYNPLSGVPVRLFFILATLLSVYVAPAKSLGITGVLEGRIRDKSTGEPLPGVNIVVLNSHYGSASDSSGYYLIGNVRAGVYSVRFSMVGFASVEMEDVTVLPDLRTRIDIDLDPSSLEIGEIIVRADRPLIQRDLPATVYAVGGVKLEKLPVSSFREVLALQPGTTIEGNVRGGKTTEVLFLVDGLPIQDVLGGGPSMNLPRSAITGLTIHTGGYEAEYGNALSGVVNIITRSGTNRHHAGIRIERDSWLPSDWNRQQNRQSEFEVSAGGPIRQNRAYYYTAHLININDTRWWQDFRHFFNSPISSEFSGFNKFDYYISPKIRAALHGVYSVRRWHDYEFSWRFNLTGLPSRKSDTNRLAFSLNHTLGKYAFYSITASRYYHRSRLNERGSIPADPEPYEYDFFLRYIVGGQRYWHADARQIVYTLKGDFTAHIALSHIVKFGVEYNMYDLTSELIKLEPQLTYFGKPIPDAALLNYSNGYEYRPRSGSIYLQDKIELVRDGTSISFGVRWDFLDPTATRPIVEFIPRSPGEYEQVVTGYAPARIHHQVSPRIALAAPVGTSTFFFLNFGHYFQYPLFDLLYSGMHPAQIREGIKNVQAGNPDLEPERTIMWEGGFKYGVRDDVVVSITMFRKNFKNQIDSKTLIPFDSKSSGDYGYASYVNNAEATANGMEFVIAKEKGEPYTGSISYTYMYAEGISEYVDQTLNYAQWGFPLAVKPYPLSWDQRHSIKGDLEFVFNRSVHGNLILLYNSGRPYTYFPTRDGYTPVDTTKVFLPNNARMQSNLFLNVKIEYDISVSPSSGIEITVFADVRNILNSKNVRWIDSTGRIGGELGDPGAYYDPRRINIGVRLTL